MAKGHYFMWVITSLCFCKISANLNIYLDQNEVKRVFGKLERTISIL